jgi:hypothetical protein
MPTAKKVVMHREEAPAPAPKTATTSKADTTVAGGRYVVNGQTVDANGQPVKE